MKDFDVGVLCLHCGNHKSVKCMKRIGEAGGLCRACFERSGSRWTPYFILTFTQKGIAREPHQFDYEYIRMLPDTLRERAQELWKEFLDQERSIPLLNHGEKSYGGRYA